MIRKLSVILGVVLLASLPLAALSVRGSWKLSDTSFTVGSLHAKGTFSGVGNTDATVQITASGVPVITCTSPGGNEAPGQNPSVVTTVGLQNIDGGVTRNGRAPLLATAPNPVLDWKQAGCANSNWTVRVLGVLWTNATITVYDGSNTVFNQSYCLQSNSIAIGAPVTIVPCSTP